MTLRVVVRHGVIGWRVSQPGRTNRDTDAVRVTVKQLVQIPAGVWSVDAWLSETGGGANHAEIWIEVEKWDGSTITTSASTYNYAVTGAGDRARLLQIYDSTNRAFLEQRNKSFFTDQLQLMANPTQGKPAYYQFNGISAGGDIKVDLFPIPDNTYSVKLDLVVPTADLSSGTDSVSIPSKPIVLLAWAKAIEERGEDGGINVSSQYAVAKQSLLDYIAVEAARHPDETIWYSV